MVWNCFLFNEVLCDSLGYQLPYVPLSPKWFFIWEIKTLGKKGGGCGDGGSAQVQKSTFNITVAFLLCFFFLLLSIGWICLSFTMK